MKYYEANLALKAIEDSVIVESFVINTSRKLDHSGKLESKSATLHQSINCYQCDAAAARGGKPVVFMDMNRGDVVAFTVRHGGL